MKSRQLSRSSRKTIEKYINTIKKELPIYGKHERKYLRMLSGIIYDYAEASENATITTAELISNFGDPQNCAYEYIEALDSDAIYYNMGIRRYGRYLFLTALSIMLAFTLCVSFMMYKEWQISRKKRHSINHHHSSRWCYYRRSFKHRHSMGNSHSPRASGYR